MNNDKCNALSISYIKKLGYKNISQDNLNNVMNNIQKKILHWEYKNFKEAVDYIPKQASYLINFIHIFSIYIDKCKNTNYHVQIKQYMCDNQCNLCKIYHLLTSWGLLITECLKMNVTGLSNKLLGDEMYKEKTIKNCVLYNNNTFIDFTNVKNCFNRPNQLNNNLKRAYTMISMGLYLREEFTYFCDKSIDIPHQNFINILNKTKSDLLQAINNKNKLKNKLTK